MNSLKTTDREVYQLGFVALADELGPTDTSRFLNLIEPRSGNFTAERHEWLDNLPDIDTIVDASKRPRTTVAAGPRARRSLIRQGAVNSVDAAKRSEITELII